MTINIGNAIHGATSIRLEDVGLIIKPSNIGVSIEK